MTLANSEEIVLAKPAPRLESVDILRGLVMVLMVLDHVRDFFGNAQINATDPATTTIPLFFTRWVTHFCAPTFVFLAGTGAYLAGCRGMSKPQLSRFLLTRGLWLAFLELTLVRLGLTFDLTFQFFPLTVLWAIGISMVVLSVLVYLPTTLIAWFGVSMIVVHNAFDGVNPQSFGNFADVWRVLHIQGMLGFQIAGRPVFGLYPLVPWIGVMAAGYAFGAIVKNPNAEFRRVVLWNIGLAMIALFVFLRWLNVYGDFRSWSVQERGPAYTLLSFLNCTKYPPSLLYLLMTLGPAITLLAVFDWRGAGIATKPLVTLGRVPLFYYLLQWPLIHLLAVGVNAALGQDYKWLLGNGPFEPKANYGYSLPVVYLMWGVTLLLIYAPCAWFAGLKKRHRDWRWLSYL
jgi:uncharacterized membrane protein